MQSISPQFLSSVLFLIKLKLRRGCIESIQIQDVGESKNTNTALIILKKFNSADNVENKLGELNKSQTTKRRKSLVYGWQICT